MRSEYYCFTIISVSMDAIRHDYISISPLGKTSKFITAGCNQMVYQTERPVIIWVKGLITNYREGSYKTIGGGGHAEGGGAQKVLR